VSRLVARSAGERPAVRPRIAPAFAQLAESTELAPAGESLRGAPETPRAIAPLPLDGQRPADRARAEQNRAMLAANPGRDASQRSPTSYFPHGHEKPRDEETENAHGGVEPAPRKETLTLAASSVPSPAAARAERVPTTVPTERIEPAPAAVLEAVAIKRETTEELKVVAKAVDRTVAAPQVFPTVRPVVGKAHLPLEASKKKPASEPAIQVTIGKIEVRASIAAPKSAEKKMPSGAISLEEYQRMRSRRSPG
jgi:hypothetical protein